MSIISLDLIYNNSTDRGTTSIPDQRVVLERQTLDDDMVHSGTRCDTRDPASVRSAAVERSYISQPIAVDAATSARRSPSTARRARHMTTVRTVSTSCVCNKVRPLKVLDLSAVSFLC